MWCTPPVRDCVSTFVTLQSAIPLFAFLAFLALFPLTGIFRLSAAA